MRAIPRILILAALCLLMWGIMGETRKLDAQGADASQILPFFLAIVGLALILGVVVALWIAPIIGNLIGSFFFNPGEEIRKNPHSSAMERVAQGDYSGAIDAYKTVAAKNPGDMHAIGEIVHLYCDTLQEPASAVEFLERILETDQPAEDAAFVASRLAEVHWVHLRDGIKAKAILAQITRLFPETTFAANAMHKMREIDQAAGHPSEIAPTVAAAAPLASLQRLYRSP